jgi:holo-ACP synthase
LISRFGRPLISFSLNIPGPDKLSGPWARVMAVGLEAIEQQMRERSLAIRHRESGRTAAGLEAFLVVEADAAGLKELAMAIERDHPLGRLFDLDVLDERAWPLSRESYGESKRACVICGGQTALCRRGGQHTTEVVLRRLEEIVSTYFQAPA